MWNGQTFLGEYWELNVNLYGLNRLMFYNISKEQETLRNFVNSRRSLTLIMLWTFQSVQDSSDHV